MNNAGIFISYSHRGNGPQWKSALLRALRVFEQHHLLDVWQDGKIRVSSFWDGDIKQAMSGARLAVVLLTKEALESEYILDSEFPFLRERQQRDALPVFPVICEPCDWKAHEWLRATQAPNNSDPLFELSEAAQNRVFRQLAIQIAGELSRGALAELPKPEQPLPPDRIYLDKFPLTRGPGLREEKLIGREQEFALLDLAFTQPHTAIVSLVAWGGVGKTMLVQHWLQRLQREGWFGAQRVYAWSFYSQGTKEDRQASEDSFLAHTLDWFGVQCEPTLSPWDKGRLLAEAVTRERTLLILDGIEPLQYPPGPMGGQLRAPGVQSLLKQLARKASSDHSSLDIRNSSLANGLCLVTTREPLTDLADFQRRPDAAWGSVLRVDLGNLTAEAGAALLHHAGANRAGAAEIAPDDTELLAASREVDGHALTLNLLGRFLARAYVGDIRRRDLVKFEEADRKEQGGTTFKMLAAFERWFASEGDIEARALTVLRLLGLFDRPADAGCLGALRKPPVLAGVTEPLFTLKRDLHTGTSIEQPLSDKAWNDATHFLEIFGLVAIQADTDNRERLVDSHPLIREYFARELSGKNAEAWRSAHRRVFDLLADTTEYQPETLAEIEPLFHAVRHGCEAGMHQRAYQSLIERIDRNDGFAWRRLGAYGSVLNCVACFLDRHWQRAASVSASADGWLVNEAGLCLRALGRLPEAREAMRTGTNTAAENQDWISATTGACSISETSLLLGDVEVARREALSAIGFAEKARGQEKVRAIPVLADALRQAGQEAAAERRFREAEAIQRAVEPDYRFLYSVRGFRFCDLLLSRCEHYAWARHLKLTAWTSSLKAGLGLFESSLKDVEQRVTENQNLLSGRLGRLSLALDELTLGRAALYRAVPDLPEAPEPRRAALLAARGHIGAAVERLQGAATQHHIPSGLLTRAWLRLLQGDPDGARADLDEAWDIAERGPMRLHLADIHLCRARLFFREKPYPWKFPQDDLAAAEKLINDCGYHRRDEELADAKRAILGA